MRIPLKVSDEQLLVEAVFHAPDYQIELKLVTFVVDTGSTISSLGYTDVIKLAIPEKASGKAEELQVGGQTLELRELHNVLLTFQDMAGNAFPFQCPRFYASFPRNTDFTFRLNALAIPSILGIDFLRQAKLALYCNPSQDTAYFETTSSE